MDKTIKKAFTLIELLVVIAIIGILSGLIVAGMNGAVSSANMAKAKVFSTSLRDALLANLVSEWKFDGTTADGNPATANDVLDTWNHTSNGAVPYPPTVRTGSNCVSGSCLQFDGTDDYVNCGNGASLQGMSYITISAWANFSSMGGSYSGKTIFNKGANNSIGTVWFYQNTSNNRLYFELDQSTAYYSWTPTLNQWYHLTSTYDGTNVKWYINGSLVKTSAYGTKTINNALDAYIGSYLGMADRSFIGLIDDIRIYNAAMPTSQIKEQYYAGLNRLLANGAIGPTEYSLRIKELSSADF